MRREALPSIVASCAVASGVFPAAACDLEVQEGNTNVPTTLTLNGGTPFHSTLNAVSDARCIPVPDSPTVVVLWNELESDRGAVPYYAISLDGISADRVARASYDLALEYAQFDPAVSSVAVEGLLAADDSTNLFIVQFVTQPLDVYTQHLRSLGIAPITFVPNHALLVNMNGADTVVVEQLPYVRAVVPYHPAFRLEPYLVQVFADADVALPPQRYYLRLTGTDVPLQTATAARITDLGGTVNGRHVGTGMLDVTLTQEQLSSVFRWDEVVRVHRWKEPALAMDNARRVGGANYVESVAGFAGLGVRGVVMDTNLADHYEYSPLPFRLTPTPPGPYYDCHGNEVYGVVFSDGSGDARARGILSEGDGGFVDAFDGPFWFGRLLYSCLATNAGPEPCEEACDVPDDPDFPEIPAFPGRAVFQSNSWTAMVQQPAYDLIAQAQDLAVFETNLLVCQAQGNPPNQCSFEEAWAKNVISVGGVSHSDTACPTDDGPVTGCTGPAGDGRVKPDLASFYDHVFTTSVPYATVPPNPHCPANYVSDFCCTSAATPIVCGYAGLFFEMWGKPKSPGSSANIFGRTLPVPEGDVFDNRSHAATAKAMLINTARQYEFVNGINRYNSGWGAPDVRRIHELRDRFPVIVDESVVLPPFASQAFNVTVEPGVPALKATMVYTDVPGNPSAAIDRVNDLSLRATSPSDVKYVGNYGMVTGHWSAPNGAPDTLNNVENIFIQNPQAGVWTFTVKADEITLDGHPETPGVMDADFALVVSVDYPRCPETEVSIFCGPCCVSTNPEVACPGGTGHVNCCDANVCTYNRCINPGESSECRFEGTRYGNVNGDANHLVNLDDITCAMDCFGDYASCPNADIAPACTGNGICAMDDILAVLAAFGGADPCGCVVPQ